MHEIKNINSVLTTVTIYLIKKTKTKKPTLLYKFIQ